MPRMLPETKKIDQFCECHKNTHTHVWQIEKGITTKSAHHNGRRIFSSTCSTVFQTGDICHSWKHFREFIRCLIAMKTRKRDYLQAFKACRLKMCHTACVRHQLKYLSAESLKWLFANEKVWGFLVFANFSQCHSSRAISMTFLRPSRHSSTYSHWFPLSKSCSWLFASWRFNWSCFGAISHSCLCSGHAGCRSCGFGGNKQLKKVWNASDTWLVDSKWRTISENCVWSLDCNWPVWETW